MKIQHKNKSNTLGFLNFGRSEIISLMGVCLIMLAACSTNTPVPSAQTSALPSQTPLPALTSTPTVTPTPRLPVSASTQVPVPRGVISADNVDQVVELARWGKGVITDAVYSPHGEIIAVGSTVGIFVYKAEALEEILAIDTNAKVNSIMFSPNSQSMAAGFDDKTVKIWGLDGMLQNTLEGHTGSVLALAYSPNGESLASASDDREVNIWKTSDGSLLKTYKQDANVFSLIYSADGSSLFIGLENGTNLVNVENGLTIHFFRGHTIRDLAISKDGKIFASFGEATLDDPKGEIDVWQIADSQKLTTIEGTTDFYSDIKSIDLSSDGQYVLAGWGDYTAKVWSAANGALLSTFEDLKPKSGKYYYHFFAAAYAPDDGSFFLAGSDVIGIWDSAKGTLLQSSHAESQSVREIDLSKDGQILAAVEGPSVRLWQMSNGQLAAKPTEDIETNGDVSISPDGSSLAVALFDGTARIWPLTDEGTRRSIETEKKGYFTSATFSPDGQLIALAASYPGNIELRNVSDGTLVRTISIGANISFVTVTFSPDGQYIAASAADSVRLFRVLDGKAQGVYKGGISLAFSPDSKLVAGGALQNALRIWDVATGEKVFDHPELDDSVTAVAFSPDGKLLASADFDGMIFIWDVSAGTLLRSWHAHSDMITGLVFSSDGKLLISSSSDGTIRQWGMK